MTMKTTHVHVVSVRLDCFLIIELKISPERYRRFFCFPVWHFGPLYPAGHLNRTFLFVIYGPLDSVHLKKAHKELCVKQFKEQFE